MVKNKEIKKKMQTALNAELISAIESSFSGKVRRLLKKGANSNSIDEKGDTVLYIAARKGDAKIVHLLLKKGAKNNVSKEITPLDIAVILENLEVIQLLIKEDRDIDLNQNNQNIGVINPLSLAIFHKKLGSVRLLLESGAEVLSKYIPRHMKCCETSHQIFKLLIPHLLLKDPSITHLESIQECQELLTTWDDSLTQIKKMQSIFISEVYSYYDLLKIDSNRLVESITTNSLMEAQCSNFNENFSKYADMLQKKLEVLVALKEKQNANTTLAKKVGFFKNSANTSSVPEEISMRRSVLG